MNAGRISTTCRFCLRGGDNTGAEAEGPVPGSTVSQPENKFQKHILQNAGSGAEFWASDAGFCAEFACEKAEFDTFAQVSGSGNLCAVR